MIFVVLLETVVIVGCVSVVRDILDDDDGDADADDDDDGDDGNEIDEEIGFRELRLCRCE